MSTTKTTPYYNIQLSILGDERVGKSSVLQAISKYYIPDHDLGDLDNVDEIRVSLPNGDSPYILTIREQFAEEHYLSRAHMYSIGWVLAFDLTAITSIQSFEEYYNRYDEIMVRRLVFSGWVPDDQPHTLTDVLLIGTKADLATHNRLSRAQIEEFARSKSVHYLETPLQSNEAMSTTLNKMATSIAKGTLYHTVNTRYTRKKKRTRCIVM